MDVRRSWNRMRWDTEVMLALSGFDLFLFLDNLVKRSALDGVLI